MIEKIVLTEEEQVLNFLQKLISGTEYENNLYAVGGYVRDLLMGLKPKDLDFVVNGNINSGINFSVWLANKLGNFKKGSNPVIYPRFGTSKLSLNGNNSNLPNIELEFVAPRVETYTNNSRKPDVVGGNLYNEVRRRDISINSLLKNISTNEILDLTGNGINDIKNGIIRTTSNADEIFKQDGLRMLRAIRMTVKFNFKLDLETIKAISRNAHLIDNISKERISDELNKILLSPNPSLGIRLLKTTGLLPYIMEEYNETVGMKQNKYHTDDVFGHTMSVLSNTPPELKTRLMALFHDIGKTLTRTVSPDGSVHFYDHESVGVDVVKSIMTRLKYPNDLINSVVTGVKNHMYLKHGEDDTSKLSDKTLRKFRSAVGENLEEILDLIHADNISHSDEGAMPNQITNVRDRLQKLSADLDTNKPTLPINGNDLISLGFKPSPLMREILNAVEEAWFENPNITKDEALRIADGFKNREEIEKITNEFKKYL